jgi:hypothetical protein
LADLRKKKVALREKSFLYSSENFDFTQPYLPSIFKPCIGIDSTIRLVAELRFEYPEGDNFKRESCPCLPVPAAVCVPTGRIDSIPGNTPQDPSEDVMLRLRIYLLFVSTLSHPKKPAIFDHNRQQILR